MVKTHPSFKKESLIYLVYRVYPRHGKELLKYTVYIFFSTHSFILQSFMWQLLLAQALLCGYAGSLQAPAHNQLSLTPRASHSEWGKKTPQCHRRDFTGL